MESVIADQRSINVFFTQLLNCFSLTLLIVTKWLHATIFGVTRGTEVTEIRRSIMDKVKCRRTGGNIMFALEMF